MTTTDVPGTIYWDPYDTEIDADPHPVWKRMRDEQPVYRNERYDFWALSRHDDRSPGATALRGPVLSVSVRTTRRDPA